MNLIVLQAGGSPNITLIFYLLLFAIIYFFFLRPQVKKQKAQNKFMDELKKGDEVVTGSGIIGKINKIEGNIVELQVDTKTFLRVLKGAISREMTESNNPTAESK